MNHRPTARVTLTLLALAAGLLLTACTGNRQLARRAHAGDAAAQFEYGRRLLTGQYRLYAVPQHAPGWFKLAAVQGYAPAQAALGACHEAGLGLPVSLSQAKFWYGKAAAQGNPMAAMHLAMLAYREERDPARALKLLAQAANAGYVPARLRYASVLLKDGNATPQQTRLAMDQLRIAAMDGSGEAAYLMGLFYASGECVPQHSGIALGWFEIAAEAGFEPAKAMVEDLRDAE